MAQASIPSNILTGKFVGRFIVGVVDGVDEDDEPDYIPATGTITFTPTPAYMPSPTSSEGALTILQTPSVAILDDEGYLCTPDQSYPGSAGKRGIRLIAGNSPHLLVDDWTYAVSYSFGMVNGTMPAIPGHSVMLLSGETVDLTNAVKVPSSPGIGIEQAEALAAQAKAVAQSVRDDADAGAFKGEKGDTGADSIVPGPQGEIGPRGPQGDPGADSTVPGPEGPPGDTAAIEAIEVLVEERIKDVNRMLTNKMADAGFEQPEDYWASENVAYVPSGTDAYGQVAELTRNTVGHLYNKGLLGPYGPFLYGIATTVTPGQIWRLTAEMSAGRVGQELTLVLATHNQGFNALVEERRTFSLGSGASETAQVEFTIPEGGQFLSAGFEFDTTYEPAGAARPIQLSSTSLTNVTELAGIESRVVGLETVVEGASNLGVPGALVKLASNGTTNIPTLWLGTQNTAFNAATRKDYVDGLIRMGSPLNGSPVYLKDPKSPSIEQLVQGSTGWRDITSLAGPARKAERLLIQRRNWSVELIIINLPSGSAGQSVLSLPQGFGLSGPRSGLGMDRILPYMDASGMTKMAAAGNTLSTQSPANCGFASISYPTDDAWPTALPGTPVS